MMHLKRWLKWIILAAMLLAVVGFSVPHMAKAQGGSPDFRIDTWSTLPEELKRGEEFDLTVTFTNIGTANAGQIVVDIGQGGTFVLLGQSTTIDWMGVGNVGTAVLHVGVSNTITTGFYSIPVQFTYNVAGEASARMTSVQQVGVHVTGLAVSTGGGVDTGRPQLLIEDSDVAPTASGELNLSLTLRNTGNRWAQGIIIHLGQSEYFSPAKGSSAFPVEGVIKLNETKTVVLPLIMIGAPTQRITQDFTIEYTSPSGAGPFQSQQSVPITLGTTASQVPRLLIESYTTDPASVTPGAAVTLELELTNVGGGPANEVFVRLGQDSTTLGPLAPVGSSNLQYVAQIDGGDSETITYNLIADGSAEAGIVAIDVQLEYLDEFGINHEETQTISVQVVATPHFQVGLFDEVPDPIFIGDTFDLSIEIINIGQTQINVSTIEVISDDLAIDNGSAYVGPLDGGTSGTIIASAEAEQAGTAEVEVRVNYLDNFQQPQIYVQTLTFEVADEGESTAEDEDEPSSPSRNNDDDEPSEEEDTELTASDRILRAILGFFGLGTQPAEIPEFPQPSGED